MKSMIALIACALLANLGFPARGMEATLSSGQDLAVATGGQLLGSRAPDLKLQNIDGGEIDLGALYGRKAVYLKFWATWCVPCREQMPHFRSVFASAGSDLAVIAIDSGFNDSLEDVRSARAELGLRMPIVLDDGTAGEAFRLRVTPQHIVIGRDGRVLYVGHLADERLDAALLAARSGAVAEEAVRAAVPFGGLQTFHVGDQLPDLVARTLDGREFRARDSTDRRPTVLVFMSSWCESYLADSRPAMSASCRQVREQVDALSRNDGRFRWQAIASRLWVTRNDLSDYAATYKPAIPLALDESGEWFRSFQVTTVPTVLIADSHGRIVSREEGFNGQLPTLLDDQGR